MLEEAKIPPNFDWFYSSLNIRQGNSGILSCKDTIGVMLLQNKQNNACRADAAATNGRSVLSLSSLPSACTRHTIFVKLHR